MAVINIKKLKYSILRGSFSKDGINEFLRYLFVVLVIINMNTLFFLFLYHRDLSYGRGNTSPVRGDKLPTINKVDAWDGKDGELPLEEEIDLSDISLDDKDEL